MVLKDMTVELGNCEYILILYRIIMPGTAVGNEQRGQAAGIVFLDNLMICTYKVQKMEANLR